MLNTKYYSIIVIVLGLFLYLMKIGLLVVVDPLQIFHKPWGREPYFIKEPRFQDAGIINNVEFDSIIIGSSMSANFLGEEASKLWKSRVVNLSANGAEFFERDIILKHAFRKKKIENLIMSLDSEEALGERDSNFSVESYDFLYNENFFDDFKVYLNDKFFPYIFCSSKISFDLGCCKKIGSIDTMSEWHSKPKHFNRFGGLDKWFKSKNNLQIRRAFDRIVLKTEMIEAGEVEVVSREDYDLRWKRLTSIFEDYYLNYAKKYPDTNVYVFFPPYSRINYALQKQSAPTSFELYIKFIKHVVALAEECSNMQIFCFDELSALDDVSNYKDPFHYNKELNSYILQSMNKGDHTITNKNVDRHITVITKLAEEYDIVSLGKKIANYLKKNP